MARFAIIKGTVVANIAEATLAYAQAQGWIAAPDTIEVGDSWDGNTFTKHQLTPEETAAIAEAARLAAIDDTILGDSTIQALKTMTNAEFDNWWSTNVTTLTQANNVLKRVTRVVVRRLL